jgi:GNAT superfamily N-acetyltransferase
MTNGVVNFRQEPRTSDGEAIRRIVHSTGFFRPDEVDVAVELLEERIAKGEKSGYFFVFAELDGRVVAYTCYGPIACTVHSYDLFWIATEQEQRGKGVGKQILRKTEELIAAQGGKRIWVETSSKPQYESTRAFYERTGYRVEAVMKDFYDDGDSKVVFVREV